MPLIKNILYRGTSIYSGSPGCGTGDMLPAMAVSGCFDSTINLQNGYCFFCKPGENQKSETFLSTAICTKRVKGCNGASGSTVTMPFAHDGDLKYAFKATPT